MSSPGGASPVLAAPTSWDASPSTPSPVRCPLSPALPQLSSLGLAALGPPSPRVITHPSSAPACMVVAPSTREMGLQRELFPEEPLMLTPTSSSPVRPDVDASSVLVPAERDGDFFNLPGPRLAPSFGLALLVPGPLAVYRRRRELTGPRAFPLYRPGLEEWADPRSLPALADLVGPPPLSLFGKRPHQPRHRHRPSSYTPRRSERLAAQNSGKHIHMITRAQRVVMKRLGIIEDENKADERDILRYLELFKAPLAPSHVQALAALCSVAVSAAA
ncbi:Os10g0159400 [Oryza sativa Japonica Group]|uniref:Os10g0159400 protein n=1 Tax=Oryza sativa subsp. japonica TaxID=39947 RepID=A0A0P0XSA6_ORYSJ|nr:Os10g0159400 [Oryza sativa Japonica Group]